jgi:opacity protein-like surface antigen
MRKLLVLLPLLIFPVSAWAQQTPKVEVFGGYSNLEANFSGTRFNMSGFNVAATENLNSWFGGTLDFSGHFGTENGFKTNTESLAYGPAFAYRKAKVVVPFAHAMIGVTRGAPEYLNISQSEYRFDTLVGGGIDVKVASNLALRLVQADYLMTRFSGARQDNLRLSAGIVLLFGSKK